VVRRCTRVTEVDTFDDKLGGWTEYDYADVCARCAWRREVRTKTTLEAMAHYRTRDDRLFYTGKDELLLGTLVGEVRVRANPPPALPEGWDAVPREDSARILAALLHRSLGTSVPMTFETDAGDYQLVLRPFDMSRNALALLRELASSDKATAVLGRRDGKPVLLEVTTFAGSTAAERTATASRVARLLVGSDEQWTGNADVIFVAIDAMWCELRSRFLASFEACSPLLAEMFDAVTAGIALETLPVGRAGAGLDLLAHIAPSVHADVLRSHDGASGTEVWRGAKAHRGGTTHPGQRAGWRRENLVNADAYYFELQPGDVVVSSQCNGRVMVFGNGYPPLGLAGLRARLEFAWRHRATFIDGLRLFDGSLDCETPMRAPSGEPLRLVTIDGVHPELVIEPRPSITVGRSPDNDVSLPNTIASRRQCVLSTRDGGWYLRDAESAGGTYLNHQLVKADVPLHLGDVLRFGGLTLLVC
jgi:hypothetical protein